MEAKNAAAISALQEVIASCDEVHESLCDLSVDNQSTSGDRLGRERIPTCKDTTMTTAYNLLQLDMKADAYMLRKQGKVLFDKLLDLYFCVNFHGSSKDKRNWAESGVGSIPELPQDPDEAEKVRRLLEYQIEDLEFQLRNHVNRLIDVLKDAHHAHRTKLFPKGIPEDSDIVDAILRLESERTDENTDIGILRELMGEIKGECPKATKIQTRIRRAQLDGRTSLLKRQ
jgi:hypothetical protein